MLYIVSLILIENIFTIWLSTVIMLEIYHCYNMNTLKNSDNFSMYIQTGIQCDALTFSFLTIYFKYSCQHRYPYLMWWKLDLRLYQYVNKLCPIKLIKRWMNQTGKK